MNFTRNDVGITLIAPTILGGVLGFLAYRALVPQSDSALLLLLCVAVGAVVVSAVANDFRRFLLPKDKKDIVE